MGRSRPRYFRSTSACSMSISVAEKPPVMILSMCRSTASPGGSWLMKNARNEIAQIVRIPSTILLAI